MIIGYDVVGLTVTVLNYIALGLLMSGLFYMHYSQKLNWFVYFCFVFSAVVFVVYAIYLTDVYVFIQNMLFLLFDGVGVVKMIKVKKNGNPS